MTPGYPRLLLNETVIPQTDCPLFFAALDISMMCINAGIKRTEEQWTELLKSVGFEIVSLRYSGDTGDMEAIIEVMRPM